jgi:histidinol-phosphate phosphatase family protein
VKQVIILAGGKGTRLRERLGNLPKPLIDICGVPLLERQVLLAKRHGFTDVLILVNHAAQYIVDFCAARGNWGLKVECIDDGEPRGTAGATLAIFDRLADEFLVMYGDTMLEVDLTRFHTFHAGRADSAATLLLHPNDHPHDSDLVEMEDDGRITAFHPYPHDPARYYPNLVNAALYWVRKSALAPWRNWQGGLLDFGKDLFPDMLRQGARLRGFNSPEYIKDVGTPARVDKVCGDLQSGKIARASLERAQAMVFLDRDGTLNREVDHLASAEQFELLPGVEEAVKRLNRSEYRCAVVTNQPVIARGECSVEELRRIHNKMETLLGRQGAFVDRIYYCPHHPHAGFPGERPELKIDCACRKPKTGMIDQAAEDFNLAREHSWMVGDSSIDMETARRAGLKSVLVETGYAGMDYREWATPDAIVPDLNAAVSYILDIYPRLHDLCTGLVAGISAPPGDKALVLVGGHARSGKSTFTSVLRDAINRTGRKALVLSIDRWLKEPQARQPGVLGRYDLGAIQAILRQWARSAGAPDLALPGYHKLQRKTFNAVENVPISSADVILVEGTVALALEPPPGLEIHRYNIEIEEEIRKERVINEYRLRGFDEASASAVYVSRRGDEFPLIEDLSRTARIISLPQPTALRPT